MLGRSFSCVPSALENHDRVNHACRLIERLVGGGGGGGGDNVPQFVEQCLPSERYTVAQHQHRNSLSSFEERIRKNTASLNKPGHGKGLNSRTG